MLLKQQNILQQSVEWFSLSLLIQENVTFDWPFPEYAHPTQNSANLENILNQLHMCLRFIES